MIEWFLIAWNLALTLLLMFIMLCQNNQEKLLYFLRNEVYECKQKQEGHIFCKTVDSDFNCPKVKRND